ncbi:MAG: hypothetical protein H0X40_07795 [Chthoniobacterales bacterium]|nr:hypothetical protein [Chthoniobacterales bacterium]
MTTLRVTPTRRHSVRRAALIATMTIIAGSVLTITSAKATDPVGVTTTILTGPDSLPGFTIHLKTDNWKIRMEANSATDVYVVDNVFAANANTGWHSHPGPSIITVLSGTITSYEGDDPMCTPHFHPAGTAFVDQGGTHVHLLRNEGTDTAETIATQLIPAGADRRLDEPDPGFCPF